MLIIFAEIVTCELNIDIPIMLYVCLILDKRKSYDISLIFNSNTIYIQKLT